MICDECKHLELRKNYKIVCRLHNHQLLDVKRCINFEKIEDDG